LAQPVAGIHRVAVAKVVAQLMRGGAAVIDTAIEAEGLLPKVPLPPPNHALRVQQY
jgi:hypothetical protein